MGLAEQPECDVRESPAGTGAIGAIGGAGLLLYGDPTSRSACGHRDWAPMRPGTVALKGAGGEAAAMDRPRVATANFTEPARLDKETLVVAAAPSAGMVPLMTRLRPAALAVVSLLAFSACASTSTDPIALPSKDAAPVEVLGAYPRALKTGDCKAAHALATRTFTFGNGELCGISA